MRPLVLRHALCALLMAALACASSACQPQKQGTIDVAVIGSEPRLADPSQQSLDAGESLLLGAAAQGLVRFDARGQIEPGLAERWNVSDDGLSYIFRIGSTEWSGGGRVTAEQVARVLRRQLTSSSDNDLKDTLGAVDEIVAMTDRVIEIRLTAPRPGLLQLLAQPEFAVVRNGQGTGPFRVEPGDDAPVRLTRSIAAPDGDEERREQVTVRGLDLGAAVRGFLAGDIDLVLGGTFANLPLVRGEQVPDDALQFDPVSGLFGLLPVRSEGLLADPEVRQLLSQAIDREALLAQFNVPGLTPRATVLEPGLDGIADVAPPPWTETPIGDRRPALIAAASRLLGDSEEPPRLRIHLPEGPGADLLLNRLSRDWGLLGIEVERAATPASAELVLIDRVAPSTSPAWFLRHFRCDVARICDPLVDEMIEAGRAAPVPAQRAALLAEAARRIDELQLFLPLAAPIRWSLVADRVEGFSGNRFARHTLTGLGERLNREGPD